MTKEKERSFDFQNLKRIFTYAKPYRIRFTLAIVTTLIYTALLVVKPYLIMHTFDDVIAQGNVQRLIYMTILLIILLILEGIFQFTNTYLTNTLGQNIINDLRTKLYKHILHLRIKYYDNTPIGTIVTRAVSDIEVINSIFSEGIIVIIADLLSITAIVGVMLYTNYRLTLITLIPIPFLFVATYYFKKSVQASFQDVRNQVARLNTFVQEHVTGMLITQIFNREKAEMNKFEKINAQHRDANIRSVLAYSIFFPIVEVLSSISLGLLIWWGGNEALRNHTTMGELIMFVFYLNMLFRPIRQLADRFNTLQMGMVSSERVFKVLDTNEFIENAGNVDAENIKGDIAFKNIWFAYNNEDWVLKNINFEIKQGETIALVGATGGGKSSIINLLNRLYEYNEGEITIDGINIKSYELSSLRKNIGVVLQDVFLFSDSLMNNISLNNKNITREEVVNAAKMVGAHQFIEKLPGGYDFNTMERGAMLSVGQRQLIAFIRAYVFNPKILVLDEATSSIDTESEQLIQKAIDILTQNRTSIVIAHRLATIQKADKILVIDNGEIAEMGNHQELLHNNGHYKRLFELQFKEVNAS